MPTLVSVFGIEPRRIGGTETFARELSLQLGERGWKSVLLFLSEPTAEVRRFLDLPNTSLGIYASANDGSLKIGRNLAGITRAHQPEILHLHFTGFLNLYSWIARAQSVKKVFFTDHHSRSAGYVPARAPFWKRHAARFINGPLTKVISVSNYGYECMTAFDLLPRNRFKMIYNGVDLSRVKTDTQRALDFRRRYAIPAGRAIVTQVSWMIPEKGISDFLETARLVTTQNRNVQFVIVGDGAYREQYMKDAEAMGIEDRVTWTGMVEDPFGEGVFAAADIVCQLSRWEEVFGWMIAEAMAHGKPIVATRVGGIPELISEGLSGFLVERTDAAAAAKKLIRLLQDPGLRRAMGDAGRKLVAERFNLKTNVAQLVKLYDI
ncbi:MAG: L-malate glycosyltransferase [Pyrinomonadaceae bacterium]|jgi:glycosyltransferase involved in cell wall biosynthesis|nr:L-malate glycosyltransferase [Pyrinomonadaceae bacterium]